MQNHMTPEKKLQHFEAAVGSTPSVADEVMRRLHDKPIPARRRRWATGPTMVACAVVVLCLAGVPIVNWLVEDRHEPVNVAWDSDEQRPAEGVEQKDDSSNPEEPQPETLVNTPPEVASITGSPHQERAGLRALGLSDGASQDTTRQAWGDDTPRPVGELIETVMASLSAEFSKISSEYQELPDADAVRITRTDVFYGLDYIRDCTYLGKRGHEDTGPHPVHLRFEVYSLSEQGDPISYAVRKPDHTWNNLRLVGWTRVYVGEDASPGFADEARRIIDRHVAMVDALDRRAKDTPPPVPKDWGWAVEGVQLRLHTDSLSWPQGTLPELLTDFRNRGVRDLRIELEHKSWRVELDGKWHEPNSSISGLRRSLTLGPGEDQQDVKVWINADDNLGKKLRELAPGKHTLRVAKHFMQGHPEERLRVVSNRMEVEILPSQGEHVDIEELTPEGESIIPVGDESPPIQEEMAAWSHPVDGLRIRLRTTQRRWTPDATPTLVLDLRNDSDQGNVIRYEGGQESECEIEVDGQWYRWLADSSILKPRGFSLKAGDTKERAIEISLTGAWARDDARLNLKPGTHRVRVAFSPARPAPQSERSRVVSNPVEIELLPDQPATD